MIKKDRLKGGKKVRILAVGDVVGERGVQKVKEVLPTLKIEKKIDFVIINGENAAGGMGITRKLFDELLKAGADVITMGNHTWGKKDIFSFIDHDKLIRPANYSEGVVGKGYGIYTCQNKKIAVINLIGRTSMSVLSENPFTVVEKVIKDIEKKVDIIIVDFHAEATAEKIAMGYFLDGKVTALFGTHTHVQTADEKILPKGMGYITDIGMTGPIHSVIGMDSSASVKRFLTSMPERYKVAEGNCKMHSVLFEINDEKNQIVNIERINRK